MNLALALLAHALRMILYQPATTARVLMPALVVVLGATLAIGTLAPDAMAIFDTPQEDVVPPDAGQSMMFLLFGLIALLGYALLAVLWHRHVLLDGADQTITGLSPGLFFGYVWRAIVVGCMQLVAAIPVTLVIGGFATALASGQTSGLASYLIGLIGTVVLIWIALRISVVLPAAALGHRMAIGDSWSVTAPLSNGLWGAAVLLTGINALFFVISDTLLPGASPLAILIRSAIFLAEGLLFISLLTTLYGHLIEKRALSA